MAEAPLRPAPLDPSPDSEDVARVYAFAAFDLHSRLGLTEEEAKTAVASVLYGIRAADAFERGERA